MAGDQSQNQDLGHSGRPNESWEGASIPLSPRAMAILRCLRAVKTGPFVFEGNKAKQPLSSMAMAMQLRRLRRSDITVHGFRSSFRDWVWEEPNFPMNSPNKPLLIRFRTRQRQHTDAVMRSKGDAP